MQRIPLVCVPFAGAGASFCSTSRTSTSGAADLAPSVADQAGPGGRVASFGHSLGAVLAYEIAHALVGAGDAAL